MDEGMSSRNEKDSVAIPNISENPDDTKATVNLNTKTCQPPYDCSSATALVSLSPTSFELKESKSQTKLVIRSLLLVKVQHYSSKKRFCNKNNNKRCLKAVNSKVMKFLPQLTHLTISAKLMVVLRVI